VCLLMVVCMVLSWGCVRYLPHFLNTCSGGSLVYCRKNVTRMMHGWDGDEHEWHVDDLAFVRWEHGGIWVVLQGLLG